MIKYGQSPFFIHGNLWFPCVNSPESAVCHVTGINSEHRFKD